MAPPAESVPGSLGLGALRGQTAVVTSASHGIGKAIAASLVAAGAWVGMVAGADGELAAAAEEVGGHAIPSDVTQPAQVHQLTAYLAELLGEVPDLLVNATDITLSRPIAELEPGEFDEQIARNLRGPFLMIRAMLPHMLERGAGHIISIGAMAGREPVPGGGAYGAAKYGLRGLHEVLAREIAGSGVRTTLVEAAAADLSGGDADAHGEPQIHARQVAQAVLFAASRPSGVEVPLIAVRSTNAISTE
jgi:NADP-dependent 3-hydroxy acid dehydrogenase YdfG